jgi:hypothetical protein
MKTILLAVLLSLTSVFFAAAQTPNPESSPPASDPSANSADKKKQDKPADNASDPQAQTAQQNGYVRPNSKTRFNRYVNSMVGPMAIGRRVASAGYATWRNSPEEWGPHWEGFGRRFASGMGKGFIKQTTTYGLDEALKLDSHYYRSKKKDFGSKLTNALLSPVTARNKNGKRVIGVPRLAGTYAAGIIAAETWYPARFDWKDGVKSGTVSLGITAAFNLFKEFIWKK